jgi:beta-lactamase regulating signal transducer with metallopeptidase domain
LALVIVHPWTPPDAAIEPALGAAPAAAAGGAIADTLLLVPQPPRAWVLGALALWLGLLAVRGWQMVRGLRAIAELKRRSRAFDPTRAARLPLWRAASQAGRPCELRVTDRAVGACALGFRRPVILVSDCLVRALDDAELDQIIVHEHAHLRRYDDWSRLAQCLIVSALGVHPAVSFIGARIDLEREAACDDVVVAWTGAPRSYASCLARAAAVLLAQGREQPALAPAAARSSAVLRSRVTRLLARTSTRPPTFRWLPATAGACGLMVVVAATNQMPPLVMFADMRVDARAASPAPANVVSASLAPLALPPGTAPAQTLLRVPTTKARDVLPGDRVVDATTATPVPQPAAHPHASLPVIAAAPFAMDPGERILLDGPPGVPAPAQMPPQIAAPAAPQPPDAASSGAGQVWVDVGMQAAHVGTAVAGSVQHFGQGVGGWFAGVARAAVSGPAKKKSS